MQGEPGEAVRPCLALDPRHPPSQSCLSQDLPASSWEGAAAGSSWSPEPHPDPPPRLLPPPPQTEALQPTFAKLSEVLPKVSETVLSQISSMPSVHSAVASQLALPRALGSVALDHQVQHLTSQSSLWHTHHMLPESLTPFFSLPDIHVRSSEPDAMPDYLPLLEQTDWSRSKMLDLESIDALNFFCEQQRRSLLQEEAVAQRPYILPPNAVVPQPRDHL